MAGRAPLRALRLANPAVRLVLGSHAHRLLSGQLLVLAYRGHVSGRTFRIPLRYAELPDRRLVVVAVRPVRKLWWRSFVGPTPAAMTLRGKIRAVVGAVTEGAPRDEALAAYVGRYPRSERVVRDAAIVVFTPTSR